MQQRRFLSIATVKSLSLPVYFTHSKQTHSKQTKSEITGCSGRWQDSVGQWIHHIWQSGTYAFETVGSYQCTSLVPSIHSIYKSSAWASLLSAMHSAEWPWVCCTHIALCCTHIALCCTHTLFHMLVKSLRIWKVMEFLSSQTETRKRTWTIFF